jgi:SAM-dependent methyltransferase
MRDLKKLLGPWRRAAANALHRFGVPIRRKYYVGGHAPTGFASSLAGRVFGLDDASAVGSRRIEIGGGPYPRPGFIHVDIDPASRHLEYRALASKLPFPTNWATLISAIHVLEHVPPPFLDSTLRECHRVLAPGGEVHLSVPNGPALMQKYLTGSIREKWLMSAALLGMYASPQSRGPLELGNRADHQVIFDFSLMRSVLEGAGFSDVTDATGRLPDRHTDGWRHLIDNCSLVVTARKA